MRATQPVSTNLKELLQRELVNRCRKNPKYSLRAFARSLEIEPSQLSKIINGKRQPREKLINSIIAKLNLSPQEAQHYAKPSNSETNPYQTLTLDHFEVIADWYHYAILELTQVAGLQLSFKSIARTLGISEAEAKLAVNRLIKLEMLEITDDHQWIDRSGLVTTVGNAFTAVAFRRLQKQVLEKALSALEETPLSERDQTSITMAMPSALLPQAQAKIKKFRRNLCKFLQENSLKKDRVYHLSISLYPVSKKIGAKNEN